MNWTRRFLVFCGMVLALPPLIVLTITLALLLALGYYLSFLLQLLRLFWRGIGSGLARWWPWPRQEPLTTGPIILVFPTRR